MGTWWPAVLIAATIGCLVDGDQEVRVPPGANITLICSYSTLQRQHVKGWYRQSPDGLVPLGRTNGWVALSHRGRLEVSDVWQKGKVEVSMVEVGPTDTGEYCCASTMLFGVDIIRRITLHVSQGEKLDHMGGQGETQTPNRLLEEPNTAEENVQTPHTHTHTGGVQNANGRGVRLQRYPWNTIRKANSAHYIPSLIQILERSRTVQEDPASLFGVWNWARWLLFWLMSSGVVLSSIIVSLKKRGLCDHRQSAAGQSDVEERIL